MMSRASKDFLRQQKQRTHRCYELYHPLQHQVQQHEAFALFIVRRPCLCCASLVVLNLAFHATCLSTQVKNAFKTAGVLRQLFKRGFFSHSGVISTEYGRSDLNSPVRHKTLLSPCGETIALSSRIRLRNRTLANGLQVRFLQPKRRRRKSPRQSPWRHASTT